MSPVRQKIIGNISLVQSSVYFLPSPGSLRQDQIAALWIAADVNLVGGKAKFCRDPNRLAAAAVKNACFGNLRQGRASMLYIMLYSNSNCKQYLSRPISLPTRTSAPALHNRLLHLISCLSQRHRNFHLFLAAEDRDFHGVAGTVLVHDSRERLLAFDFFAVDGND